MAANDDKLRHLTECSICMQPFKIPKNLPCIHTFCLECLIKYGKDELPGDEMACPLCRQMFKIPAGGFEKLPNNFFDRVQILSEVYAGLKTWIPQAVELVWQGVVIRSMPKATAWTALSPCVSHAQ